jgi:aspartate racemase
VAKREQLTVGVLGGLGPEATLDFFAKVLARTAAASDQDHLRLLIDNNPKVPNRNDAVAGSGPSPAPMLAAMARGLEAAGADFLVMACNTAHAFDSAITDASDLPFVSIIDETVAAALAATPAPTTVGVLAAAGCLDTALYRDAFAAEGVTALEPSGAQRERFMALLYRIKGGDKGSEVRSGVRDLALELIEAGAEAIVAGCTEVPLVLIQSDLPVPLIDSTDALVDATIRYATRVAPLPTRTG